MIRFLASVSLCLCVALPAAAVEEAQLGKDDFVSTAISDVFDKLGKVTTGPERIFEYDDDAQARRTADADGDLFGTKGAVTDLKPLKPAAEAKAKAAATAAPQTP